MIDTWAPPLPQAVLVVSQDMSKGVYGDVGSAAAAAAAAADFAKMRRMYEFILGGDVEVCISAPAFMRGFSVYVDPDGRPDDIERVKDEVSRRGGHVAAKTDVCDAFTLWQLLALPSTQLHNNLKLNESAGASGVSAWW
jgi:hypothetical protein